ncbi:MAG: peptide chain release factor N(5)-glutamine methyltransferase [bacterium]
MKTIADLLDCASRLQGISDTPRLDVEVLVCHLLNIQRSRLFSHPDTPVDDVLARSFESLIQRRIAGEPIAYITGKREFWSLPLTVTADTLIPRPDTELLVESALAIGQTLENNLDRPLEILDLGTGSGAIALALASEKSGWNITAVDNSPGALCVAQANGERLNLTNVNFIESDWFSNITGAFDLIVCNPPYIAETDPHITEGDVQFEPRSALTSGSQGMDDIAIIVRAAPAFLVARGVLILEHGFQQAAEIQELLRQTDYIDVSTRQDLAGNDRITIASIH